MIRHTTYSLVLCAVGAAAFVGGYWYRPREAVTAADAKAAPERTPRRVLYYFDPMHPAYKSDKPGTAPDCGMALEAVYADGRPADADAPASDAPPGAILISGEKQQLIGVQLEAVHETAGAETRRLFGRVATDETRTYRVTAGLDGYVRELSSTSTGSHVRKGEWLASFASPDARSPFGAYIQTLDVLDREMQAGGVPVQMTAARNSMTLAIDRLLMAGASPEQLEEIKQTRQLPRVIKVSAPTDGVLLARNVTLGEKIGAGTELFRLADLRRVWIVADVPAAEAADIAPGMPAQVMVPGRRSPIAARVSRALAPFDPATQSVKMRLEADNPGFALRPDMFVDVEFTISYASAVVIPAAAVVETGLRSTVFVEHSPGVLVPRSVQLGPRRGTGLTVRQGLKPGDRIAVSGTFLLDAETRMNGHDR